MEPGSPLETLFRLTPPQKAALKKLGIKTALDLLYHLPSRYADLGEMNSIGSVEAGDKVVLYGQIEKLKTSKAFRKKIAMAEGEISDGTGKIKIVWYNQPYIAKLIQNGASVKLSGKVAERKGVLYVANPQIEKTAALPVDTGDSLFARKDGDQYLPVYPESRGVSSRWFHYSIQKILKSGLLPKLSDSLPREMLKKYSLPELKTALIWIHSPQKASHAEAARKRFAFEEIFFIQLIRQSERLKYEKSPAYPVKTDKEAVEEFIGRFPFAPTEAQRKAIERTIKDMSGAHPMSRLLEGDVGSGKTAVAATAAYTAVATRPNGASFGNLQVAYMAPTEILAKQHFESFIEYFRGSGIQIGLITGSGAQKFPSKVNPSGATNISRAQLLKWLSNGEIPILIGTHALIEKAVNFKHLALVIVDEQHRFGVTQRAKLVRKGGMVPHLLSMTATPIPRTLALTIYGDLDLTLLDEMPAGRKPVMTEIVAPDKRDNAYQKVREELSAGRQAYVICPRIDEPDPEKELALEAKSVKAEAKRLKKEVFPEYEIEVLHGKMRPAEKDEVMDKFARGAADILVATSVVEVGVNVPNATVILIEGAERFGLSQLHQLRGRVIRSTYQPYCFIFSDTKTEKSLARLKALVTAKNGFELSELDLVLRGPGELTGGKQWGISDIGMEAIKNIKMVEAAREEARAILAGDPELAEHPALKEHLTGYSKDVHFE